MQFSKLEQKSGELVQGGPSLSLVTSSSVSVTTVGQSNSQPNPNIVLEQAGQPMLHPVQAERQLEAAGDYFLLTPG